MRVFLFRHAEAVHDEAEDLRRDLSPKGREQLVHLCQTLRPREFAKLAEIRHSPAQRTLATAVEFQQHMGLDVQRRSWPGLLPEDDPIPLVEEILQSEGDLMLVGHNPHLSFLAAYLMTGNAHNATVVFKKCGLLCLEQVSRARADQPGGLWALAWYVIPRILAPADPDA